MVPLPCESEEPLAQEMAKLIPLAAALEAKIAQQEQQWLLTEVEQPLAEVLASMELIGFSLDTEGLTAYGQELEHPAHRSGRGDLRAGRGTVQHQFPHAAGQCAV